MIVDERISNLIHEIIYLSQQNSCSVNLNVLESCGDMSEDFVDIFHLIISLLELTHVGYMLMVNAPCCTTQLVNFPK